MRHRKTWRSAAHLNPARCSARRDGGGQGREPTDVDRVDPPDTGWIDLIAGPDPLHKLFKRDPGLQAPERRAEAEMPAAAEVDVFAGVTSQVVAIWAGERQVVSVGGSGQQQDPLSGADSH